MATSIQCIPTYAIHTEASEYHHHEVGVTAATAEHFTEQIISDISTRSQPMLHNNRISTTLPDEKIIVMSAVDCIDRRVMQVVEAVAVATSINEKLVIEDQSSNVSTSSRTPRRVEKQSSFTQKEALFLTSHALNPSQQYFLDESKRRNKRSRLLSFDGGDSGAFREVIEFFDAPQSDAVKAKLTRKKSCCCDTCGSNNERTKRLNHLIPSFKTKQAIRGSYLRTFQNSIENVSRIQKYFKQKFRFEALLPKPSFSNLLAATGSAATTVKQKPRGGGGKPSASSQTARRASPLTPADNFSLRSTEKAERTPASSSILQQTVPTPSHSSRNMLIKLAKGRGEEKDSQIRMSSLIFNEDLQHHHQQQQQQPPVQAAVQTSSVAAATTTVASNDQRTAKLRSSTTLQVSQETIFVPEASNTNNLRKNFTSTCSNTNSNTNISSCSGSNPSLNQAQAVQLLRELRAETNLTNRISNDFVLSIGSRVFSQQQQQQQITNLQEDRKTTQQPSQSQSQQQRGVGEIRNPNLRARGPLRKTFVQSIIEEHHAHYPADPPLQPTIVHPPRIQQRNLLLSMSSSFSTVTPPRPSLHKEDTTSSSSSTATAVKESLDLPELSYQPLLLSKTLSRSYFIPTKSVSRQKMQLHFPEEQEGKLSTVSSSSKSAYISTKLQSVMSLVDIARQIDEKTLLQSASSIKDSIHRVIKLSVASTNTSQQRKQKTASVYLKNNPMQPENAFGTAEGGGSQQSALPSQRRTLSACQKKSVTTTTNTPQQSYRKSQFKQLQPLDQQQRTSPEKPGGSQTSTAYSITNLQTKQLGSFTKTNPIKKHLSTTSTTTLTTLFDRKKFRESMSMYFPSKQQQQQQPPPQQQSLTSLHQQQPLLLGQSARNSFSKQQRTNSNSAVFVLPAPLHI